MNNTLAALGCWSCRFVEDHKGRLICQRGHEVLARCKDFEYEPGSDEGERNDENVKEGAAISTKPAM